MQAMDSFPQPPSPLPPPPHPRSFLFLLRNDSLAIKNLWAFSVVLPLIVFVFVACILISRKLGTQHNDEEPGQNDGGDASIPRAQGDGGIGRSRSARVVAEVLKRVKIARMMEEPDGFVFSKEKAKINGDGGGEESSRDAATECAICLEELEDGDLCKALPQCNHVFHKECIVAWLVINKITCPLCRAAPVPVASAENLPV